MSLNLGKHVHTVCAFLNVLLFLLTVVMAFFVVNGVEMEGPGHERMFVATKLIGCACIVLAGGALLFGKMRRYAALNLFFALFSMLFLGFLREGEPPIHYSGPPTFIPGPSSK